MTNENYEVEMMETEGTELDEFETDGEKGVGLIPKLVVAGLAIGGTIVGAIALKASKAKKEGSKKKKKFHVGWVEVDDEPEVVDVEAEVVED